jgi:ribosomal protein S18 acetylase RimI-like enzyme
MQPAARRELGLRAGVPADAEFIAELARAAFGPYGEYERVLPRWLGTRGVATLIGERHGLAVGFAMLGMRPGLHLGRPDAELLAVAVAEEARGLGVGTALLREVVSIAARWRVRGVRLHTADTNRGAQRLFEREGFVRQASQEGFYPNGQGAVAMRRAVERARLFRRR